jgi:propanol-preferring alcohol dehydrogenase
MTRQGAFADYVIVDSRFAAPIPEGMSFVEAAPLTCAGATIYHSIQNADVKAGGSIAIVGVGALGHLGIMFAKWCVKSCPLQRFADG